jgi:hypothetical protein
MVDAPRHLCRHGLRVAMANREGSSRWVGACASQSRTSQSQSSSRHARCPSRCMVGVGRVHAGRQRSSRHACCPRVTCDTTLGSCERPLLGSCVLNWHVQGQEQVEDPAWVMCHVNKRCCVRNTASSTWVGVGRMHDRKHRRSSRCNHLATPAADTSWQLGWGGQGACGGALTTCHTWFGTQSYH